MRPMRTAPAVWELDGPTMMGPMISNMSIITAVPLIIHETVDKQSGGRETGALPAIS